MTDTHAVLISLALLFAYGATMYVQTRILGGDRGLAIKLGVAGMLVVGSFAAAMGWLAYALSGGAA